MQTTDHDTAIEQMLRLADSGRHQPVLTNRDGDAQLTVVPHPRSGYLIAAARAYVDETGTVRSSLHWTRAAADSAAATLKSCLRDGWTEPAAA